MPDKVKIQITLFSSGRGYYPHFVEIFTFCGYYPHFVDISTFCGNIHVPWIFSTFRGNIHVPWILSTFCVYIRISWRLSAFCGNIHVPWMLSAFFPFYLSNFTHVVKVTCASLIFLFVTQYVFLFPISFTLFIFVSEYKLNPKSIRIYVPPF